MPVLTKKKHLQTTKQKRNIEPAVFWEEFSFYLLSKFSCFSPSFFYTHTRKSQHPSFPFFIPKNRTRCTPITSEKLVFSLSELHKSWTSLEAIHIVKTEHVWRAALEIAVSQAVISKVVLGHELSCLSGHLEINGAFLVCMGLHLSYPKYIFGMQTLEPNGSPATPSRSSHLSPGAHTHTTVVSAASSGITPRHSGG